MGVNLCIISENSKIVYIFMDLKSGALVSLGKPCDDGCKINLTKQNIAVTKNEKSSYMVTGTMSQDYGN